MATVITEGRRTAEFLVSEANGYLSREQVVVSSGEGALQPGTVLAKLTATGEYVVYDNAGTDGSETAAAILYAAVDATSADAKAVIIARDAEVNGRLLVWKTGLLAADKTAATADLKSAGIIVR